MKLNGKSSRDFGLVITDWERPLQAENRDEYVNIIGIDGDLMIPKSLGNQNITVTFEKLIEGALAWKKEEKLIKTWLHSINEMKIEFDDEPGVYYIGKARNSSNPDFKRVAVEFTVDLVCQAYSIAVEPSAHNYIGNTVTEEDAFVFTSKGSAHSELILKIKPQTQLKELKINVNGVILLYDGTIAAGQTLTINTNTFMAFVNEINVTLNIIGEYPVIIPGENIIKLSAEKPFAYTSSVEYIARYL